MDIGQKIKELRKSKKIKADVLAKLLGYEDRGSIYDIQNGKVKHINRERIQKLEMIFNTPAGYFDDENIVSEPEVPYDPPRSVFDYETPSEQMAFLMEENHRLWRENALIWKKVSKYQIDVTNNESE